MNAESQERDLVVVGADGSPANKGALRWAAAEAAGTGADLLMVCALNTSASIVRVPDALHQFEAAARKSLTADKKSVTLLHPGLTTDSLIVAGKAHPELVEQSKQAAMVVVGRRGHGRFAGLLLGSTSLATAGHAHGPVVVVPKDWDESAHGKAPVAVALDVDHPDEAALQFAFQRALRHRQPLRVITVYTPPDPLWSGGDIVIMRELERESSELLEKALAAYRAHFAEVEVDTVVAQGHPTQTLLDAAKGAELLVLAPRGRGTLGGFRVGSTTRTVLLHATLPVAVVHPSSTPPESEES